MTHEMEIQSNNQPINTVNNMLEMVTVLQSDELEQKQNHLWTKLPNELLINVFNYLPHSDLQQIRLVCKRWHDFTHVPELKKKTKLVINRGNISAVRNCLDNDQDLFTRLAYNTLELQELESTDNLKSILKSTGSNIHALHLYKSPVFDILNDCLPELEELIVSHIPNAQTEDEIPLDFNKFKNFKSLDISCGIVAISIKTNLILNVLKKFSLTMEKLSLELNTDQEIILLQTIRYQSYTLKHLEIVLRLHPSDLMIWKRAFSMLRCLETLKITGVSSYEWLYQIMFSLPKETPLRHCDLSGGLQVNDTLLKLIINKWSESLQCMELMFCNALTDETVKHLGTLRHTLKSLNLSYCTKVSAEGLIQGLASEKNTVLKTLILDNMSNMNPEAVRLLASRLPQLTYLSLDNCRESVDDTTLECIFRHQTHLQHLILDDCIHISDKGLVGYGLSPAPISRLKGLQSLSLRGCGNLTNRALIKGFKFIELRKLVLSYCQKISSTGVEGLVENCPALEDLTISSCLMIDDNAMLHIATGLRRLRRLNVSNCINLTGQSLNYIIKLCKSVKELSMYGIDSLELQEVQENILLQKLDIFELDLYPDRNSQRC